MSALSQKFPEQTDDICWKLANMGPVEIRPIPRTFTPEERQEWQAEYQDSCVYVYPNDNIAGHYVITDCQGQKTIDSDFFRTLDLAIETFRRANNWKEDTSSEST